MINRFLYFHTYFGWILIESGRQNGIGGKDRQGNNHGLKRKKKERNVLREWDLASLRKNSIPCKHMCYYLIGAARSSTGCTLAPLWSQTAALTLRLSRSGGNYNYCDFPFYRVYCIIIMWREILMAAVSADIWGEKRVLCRSTGL